MGTDIHMYVERRQPDGSWVSIPPPDIPPPDPPWWYPHRNYVVFGILTGTVRNIYGSVPMVTEPRGMPDDVSEFVRVSHDWDHSPGWLTLDEVLAYDWSQTIELDGVIPFRRDDARALGVNSNVEVYEEWRHHKPLRRPIGGCGGYGRPEPIRTIDMQQADRMLSLSIEPTPVIHVVHVQWIELLTDTCADFLHFVEAYLKPLGDPRDTRLVFGFDS